MTQDGYVWWVDDDRLGIAYKSGDTYTAISTAGKKIHLYCTKFYAAPDDDEIGDAIAVPTQFQQAIVDGVVADLYLRPNSFDPVKSAVFEARFSDAVARAQVYAGRERVSDAYRGRESAIF